MKELGVRKSRADEGEKGGKVRDGTCALTPCNDLDEK